MSSTTTRQPKKQTFPLLLSMPQLLLVRFALSNCFPCSFFNFSWFKLHRQPSRWTWWLLAGSFLHLPPANCLDNGVALTLPAPLDIAAKLAVNFKLATNSTTLSGNVSGGMRNQPANQPGVCVCVCAVNREPRIKNRRHRAKDLANQLA